jgi:hypothetical protein
MMREGRMDILVHNASQWTNAGFESSWIPLWHVKCAYDPLPAQFSSSLVDQLAIAWHSPQPDAPNFLSRASPTQQEQDLPQDFRFTVTYSKSPRPGVRTLTLPCLQIRAHFLDTITKVPERAIPISMELFDLPWDYSVTMPCSECREEQNVTPNLWDHPDWRKAFELVINKVGAAMSTFFTKRSIGFAKVWQPREPYVVGDTIWILAGLAVPMILRKYEDHYFLVGECYLNRAALPQLCALCGAETGPWPMVSDVISIR